MTHPTTRPEFLLRAVRLACVLAAASPATAADRPPNIILCMGDDHGWDETAYNGHPHLQTPVLDEMAAQGRGEAKGKPYLDPELQEGTTPLVKMLGGRFTRNFRNFHHPTITESDFAGPRAVLANRYKLVIDAKPGGESGDASGKELFDIREDPAETRNLIAAKPEIADELEGKLRAWQKAVVNSLTGADYR